MRDVLKWIDRHNGAPALEILASNAGEDAPATDLLAGIVATDSREQSGIWSTASGVLAAYRTEGALGIHLAPPLDLDGVLRRAQHALPLLDRPPTAPIRSTRRRDHRRHARRRLRPNPRRTGPDPPTLLALDEVANIAPIPDLPAMVSEGAGQGLLVLACLQDLSQARVRWGLGGRRIPLAVRHDRRPARHRRHLDAARHQRAGRRPGGRQNDDQPLRGPLGSPPSLDVGRHHPQARLPVDAVAHGAPGRALVLGTDKEVHEVTLTPAHACSPWRELLPGSEPCASRSAG